MSVTDDISVEAILDDEVRREIIRLDGLLYGSLTSRECAIVDRAMEIGAARIAYEGAAGFLGLSMVRAVKP